MIDDSAIQVINRPVNLSDEAIHQALDPKVSYKYKKVYGATSPEDITSQIRESRQKLSSDILLAGRLVQQLDAARAQLQDAIDKLVGESGDSK
jgi:ABC-type transporter Mla subunit MlaD